MLKRLSQNPSVLTGFLIILLSLLASVLIGSHIGSVSLSYQDLLTGVGIIAVVIICLQKRGFEIGFLIWIGAFVLGFRVIHLTLPLIVDKIGNGGSIGENYFVTGIAPTADIHPLFIVIFLLLGLLLVQRATNWRVRIVWLVPPLLMVFSIFWIWGWVRGVDRGTYWLAMFSELMPFLIVAPIFVVTASALQRQSLWKPALLVLFLSGACIAFMGFLEFTVPSIGHVIPGFVNSNDTSYVAENGFARANFTFWGQAGAAFIVALTMPVIIPLWSWYKERKWRVFLLSCLAIEAIAIYIAGWRSIWVSMVMITLGLLVLRGKWIRALLLVMVLVVGYNFLPATTQKRAETLFSALQGHYEDNSAADRAGRSQQAIEQILNNPFGLGWSGFPWVHDDFLQITADLGIIAGILFALWYLTTLIRITQAFYESRDPLKHGLVGIFMVCGVLLLTQPMIELTQYIAPIWFAWALVETQLRQVKKQKQDDGKNQAIRANSNFQLSNSSAPMSGISKMGR